VAPRTARGGLGATLLLDPFALLLGRR
jgi:hypothetical protein